MGGSELGSYEDIINASRVLALGGSICRVLRGPEALGASVFNEAMAASGSAKEELHVRGGT